MTIEETDSEILDEYVSIDVVDTTFVPEVDVSLEGRTEVVKDSFVAAGCDIPPLVVNSDLVSERSVEVGPDAESFSPDPVENLLDSEDDTRVVIDGVTAEVKVVSWQVSHVCPDSLVSGSIVVVAGPALDVTEAIPSEDVPAGPLSEGLVDLATLAEVVEPSDSGQVVVYSVVTPFDVTVTVEREAGAVGAASVSGHVVVYSVEAPLDVRVTVERVIREVAETEDVLP